MDNDLNFVSFLWNIAESLRGTYKEEDYRKVMIPMYSSKKIRLSFR